MRMQLRPLRPSYSHPDVAFHNGQALIGGRLVPRLDIELTSYSTSKVPTLAPWGIQRVSE